MIYGKDKALNMGRSLLPSTRRKGSRDDKTAVKRITRHNIRQELHRLARDPDDYDDSLADFESYPDYEIRQVVNERRNGDKTAPFERWAEAITKNVDQDSRLTYVKSLLPDGMIGEHALTHIQWKDHFSTYAELQLEENIRLNAIDKRKKEHYLERDEIIGLLYKIIEDGRLHRELNRFMASHAGHRYPSETIRERVFNEITMKWENKWHSAYFSFPPGVKLTGPRKLLGMHDIDAYYNDIRNGWREPSIIIVDGKRYANPKAFENAYRALCTFLEAVRDKQPIPRHLLPNKYYY